MVRHLRTASNLVIEGAPGAGKTTRVPPALLALDDREVLVLEPRRLSARLAARYVSSELGEAIGGTVGYQVRFEDVSGQRTPYDFLPKVCCCGGFCRILRSIASHAWYSMSFTSGIWKAISRLPCYAACNEQYGPTCG